MTKKELVDRIMEIEQITGVYRLPDTATATFDSAAYARRIMRWSKQDLETQLKVREKELEEWTTKAPVESKEWLKGRLAEQKDAGMPQQTEPITNPRGWEEVPGGIEDDLHIKFLKESAIDMYVPMTNSWCILDGKEYIPGEDYDTEELAKAGLIALRKHREDLLKKAEETISPPTEIPGPSPLSTEQLNQLPDSAAKFGVFILVMALEALHHFFA